MLEKVPDMNKNMKKLMQRIMLSTLDFVLEVGIEEACKTVLSDNPDLDMFPNLAKYANEHKP